ncbi:hypothetical protein KIN20_014219 [Parelaphostrongylus tenuis]|uniref:Uncharacterized protein n=1 Tax=Parelaphostrongylus tenuis TaxID=148309 RepID=A0AAD5QRN8_PARTN|nr:hypothetical protein KIN20_014219 [Parelaphostrongylus tenuis]
MPSCDHVDTGDHQIQLRSGDSVSGSRHSRQEIAEASNFYSRLKKDDPACSASSALIERFVQADLNHGMISSEVRAPGESEYVNDLLHDTVQVFYSETQLSSGAFSVTVNSDDFQPTLSVRKPTTLLRPVLIDECAVPRCVKKRKGAWEVVHEVQRYRKRYEGSIALNRPQEVSVLLPSYYFSAPSSSMRPKEDNAEAFNLLMTLNLLRFIEPGKLGNIADTIKKAVNEVDALLVSSPPCTGSQRTSSSQLGKASDARELRG